MYRKITRYKGLREFFVLKPSHYQITSLITHVENAFTQRRSGASHHLRYNLCEYDDQQTKKQIKIEKKNLQKIVFFLSKKNYKNCKKRQKIPETKLPAPLETLVRAFKNT